MITIIDYGIGNLRSVEKAFQKVSPNVVRSSRIQDIERADKLVLPGVGAFGACAAELRRHGFEPPVMEAVAQGKPLLGVCVGMQLLFETGEEMGLHSGLGLLPGRVVKFQFDAPLVEQGAESGISDRPAQTAAGQALKIPHMGWNAIHTARENPLLNGIENDAYFYFVHSYHARTADDSDVLAYCNYGVHFPAIVHRNNVYGVQFHPEKSQRNGLRILANFARL